MVKPQTAKREWGWVGGVGLTQAAGVICPAAPVSSFTETSAYSVDLYDL